MSASLVFAALVLLTGIGLFVLTAEYHFPLEDGWLLVILPSLVSFAVSTVWEPALLLSLYLLGSYLTAFAIMVFLASLPQWLFDLMEWVVNERN